MWCPACGDKLHKDLGDHFCVNNKCPAFPRPFWYGNKQSEINAQWKGIPAYYKKAQKKEEA